MKRTGVLRACLLAIPLAMTAAAQPQIGGGTCNSGTLTGTYSLTMSGRDVSSSPAFTNAEQGVGIATFDGLSAVTFTLVNNTNKGVGIPLKLSGTYSLQANCIGAINITVGDTATLILGSFNSGTNFFISGQDGTYSLLGNGNLQPTAACSTTTFNGIYAFNGNGFLLNAGAITGVTYLSGLATFDGAGNVTSAGFVSLAGVSSQQNTKGTYTVTSGCTATATYTDSTGNSYSVSYTITASNGAFIAAGGNANTIFMITGRIL
jgi:hypothetical protein